MNKIVILHLVSEITSAATLCGKNTLHAIPTLRASYVIANGGFAFDTGTRGCKNCLKRLPAEEERIEISRLAAALAAKRLADDAAHGNTVEGFLARIAAAKQAQRETSHARKRNARIAQREKHAAMRDTSRVA